MSITATPIPDSEADSSVEAGSLSREQCEELLRRNVVGRLGFTLHDRVNVVPVHFIYEDGWIYGRTQPGGKLLEIVRNRRVAFEVDEHEALFKWRSVIARGPLYVIDRDEKEEGVYLHAVELLRRILPATLSFSDPVPFRTELFRIHILEITGRHSAFGNHKADPGATHVTGAPSDPDADAEIAKSAREAVERACPTAKGVHVDAFDDVVVLTGEVDTQGERAAIEGEILRLDNVNAMVQQLETAFPATRQEEPAELARDALRELRNGPPLNDSKIKLVVEHDWLRAEGTASSHATKEEVLRRLRSVRSVRGVIDRIQLTHPSEA